MRRSNQNQFQFTTLIFQMKLSLYNKDILNLITYIENNSICVGLFFHEEKIFLKIDKNEMIKTCI